MPQKLMHTIRIKLLLLLFLGLSSYFFPFNTCLKLKNNPQNSAQLGLFFFLQPGSFCRDKPCGLFNRCPYEKHSPNNVDAKLFDCSRLMKKPIDIFLSASLRIDPDGVKVNDKDLKDWKVERSLYQALHMATNEELERDSNVCVIGEDVGHYGGSYKATKDLHYLYGNLRVFDTPICENTFTGMAIGAAMCGLRPIVEGMNMGFLLLAFNQISNNAGMIRFTSGNNFHAPMVIRGPGGVGKQLGPEHSQRIEAYLHSIPGIKMVFCSTPYNARGLLKSAIRDNNPVIFFEHVLLYNVKEEIPLLPYTLPLDKAEVVKEGDDITILAYSKLRYVALEAEKELSKLNINCEIIDLISLKPLDLETIHKSIKKTGKCLILDESCKTGGVGGEIYATVAENFSRELKAYPVRLCSKDIPTPYNKDLESAMIVEPQDVINTVLWMTDSKLK